MSRRKTNKTHEKYQKQRFEEAKEEKGLGMSPNRPLAELKKVKQSEEEAKLSKKLQELLHIQRSKDERLHKEGLKKDNSVKFPGLPKEIGDNLCYLRSGLQLLFKLPLEEAKRFETKDSIFSEICTLKENLEQLSPSDENYKEIFSCTAQDLHNSMETLAKECFGDQYELQQDAGELISILLLEGENLFKKCNFKTKKLSIDPNIQYNEDEVESKMMILNFDPNYEGSVQNLIEDYLQEVKVTENGINVCESITSIENYMLISFNRTIQDSKSSSSINYLEPILLNVGGKNFSLIPQTIIVHKGDSLKCGHYIAVDVSDSEFMTIYDDEKCCKIDMEDNLERYLELSEEYRKNVTQCLYKVYPIENENE